MPSEITAEELSKLPTPDPIKSLSDEDRKAWDAYRNEQLPKLKQELSRIDRPPTTEPAESEGRFITPLEITSTGYNPNADEWDCVECGQRCYRNALNLHECPTAPPEDAKALEDAIEQLTNCRPERRDDGETGEI